MSDVADLSLPEMKVRGLAEVVSIEACPPVESGGGRVIVGTFAHVARDVYDVRLVGLADAIGVTFNHPIWSLDRGGWTSAGDLRPGEHVATETGNAVVQSVVAEPGEHRVYNIEVETDHRYLVSGLAVLVHNMSPGNLVKQSGRNRPATAFRSLNPGDIESLLNGGGISRMGGTRGVEQMAGYIGYDVKGTAYIAVTEKAELLRDASNFIEFATSEVSYKSMIDLLTDRGLMRALAGRTDFLTQQAHGLVTGEIPRSAIRRIVIGGKAIPI